MNQMIPGTIVKILQTKEFGTIIRQCKISDIKILYKGERDSLYYGHYMVMTDSGTHHVHQSQLELVWPLD